MYMCTHLNFKFKLTKKIRPAAEKNRSSNSNNRLTLLLQDKSCESQEYDSNNQSNPIKLDVFSNDFFISRALNDCI